MPARVPNATGNWSDASNWLTASNTLSIHASFNIGMSTGTINSATFTAPSTSVSCIGVAVYIPVRQSSTSIKISMQENGVTVVTNTYAASDVPLNSEGWYFFRFASPYQYTSTTAGYYKFAATLISGSGTSIRADSTTSTFAFIAVDNRTSALASTDDVFVLSDVGGTKTVTFDQNDSSVSCQTIVIGFNATLTFSRSMSTQMIVGNGTATALVTVYAGGTLEIGSVASPIPASYSAALQLDGSTTGFAASANMLQINSGAAGSGPGILSLVGDPTFNARSRVLEGFTTGLYHTTLASTASTSATTLVLTDDLGLRASGGDLIAISKCGTQAAEYRTTSAYNAATKTVTLSLGLTGAHNAGAIVSTLNRNVVLKGVNTNRPAQVVAGSNNNYALTSSVVREVQFENVARIGQNTGGVYSALSNTNFVGCSLVNLTGSSGNHLGFTYLDGNTRIINCHTYMHSIAWYGGLSAYTDTVKPVEIINGSAVGSVDWMNCAHYQIRDTALSVTSWTSGGYFIKFTNCTGADSSYLAINSNFCEFTGCVVTSLSALFDSSNYCSADKLTVTSLGNVVQASGGSYFYNNSVRNLVVGTYSGSRLFSYTGTRNTYVAISMQSCTIPSQPSTALAQYGGNVVRYTSGTVPQAVFPLPSGATVANRAESLLANVGPFPIAVTYRIPVPNAAQNNTVTIPVYLSGWGSNLPTNTQLYVELYAPGVGIPITSTTTVTANDQWQYLTVSGVSTSQGHLIVKVLLKRYVANAVMYVDWPLGMNTVNMDWYDGRPNEYLVPLTAYTAAGDLRSVRIDGPGVQEYKIPVNSRLTMIKLSARYDSEHGTTNKPQVVVLANPEIGITQQTAVMTAAANTWQQLTLNVLPTKPGVLTLRLQSRSATPWGKANFDALSVS